MLGRKTAVDYIPVMF